jgi:hypothetical protein
MLIRPSLTAYRLAFDACELEKVRLRSNALVTKLQ